MFKKRTKAEIIESITPYAENFISIDELEELKKRYKTGNLKVDFVERKEEIPVDIGEIIKVPNKPPMVECKVTPQTIMDELKVNDFESLFSKKLTIDQQKEVTKNFEDLENNKYDDLVNFHTF
jgi:hypothetical protein